MSIVLRQLVKVVVTLENDEKRDSRVQSGLSYRNSDREEKNDVRLSKKEMKELAALEKRMKERQIR